MTIIGVIYDNNRLRTLATVTKWVQNHILVSVRVTDLRVTIIRLILRIYINFLNSTRMSNMLMLFSHSVMIDIYKLYVFFKNNNIVIVLYYICFDCQ